MKYRTLIFLSLLFIALSDVLTYVGIMGFDQGYFTSVSLIVKYLTLTIFLRIGIKKKWDEDIPTVISLLFKILMMYQIITIVRGAYASNDYWDWKFLFHSSLLFHLFPFALFIGINLRYSKILFKDVFQFLFRYGFVLIPLALVTNIELYSRLMIPISVFILFIPYVKPEWRVLVLVVMVASILMYIGFRANILKIAAALAILSTYYIRSFIPMWAIKVVHATLFIVPVLLLGLAISGSYNIFSVMAESEGYEMQTNGGSSENLAADTRTLLYVEVLNTLYQDNTFLFGEGATAKYRSDLFDYLGDNRGRYSSEVAFLNILFYSGIAGITLFALFLILVSYFAIYRSNNWLCKMLGLLIAFRWFMCFVEEFTHFDLNFYFLWVVIGLLSSRAFRSLSEKQVKQFFKTTMVRKSTNSYLQKNKRLVTEARG